MSPEANSDSKPEPKKRFDLTTQILIALFAGTVWGLFLGEFGAWIGTLGDVYVGLLQMTVLPYVSLSLVGNIGGLSSGQSKRLIKVAAGVLVVLWLIGLVTLSVFCFCFPTWESGSFYTSSLVAEPEVYNWINLFIPSNPFRSLAENLVPGVVIFSMGMGIALIPLKSKEPLLNNITILIDALTRLNKMMVRLSPIGIFGVVGHTAATLSLDKFILVQGYLLVYTFAAFLLCLWIIPAFIASITPYSIVQILRESKDVMLASFIIGSTFVVLPMIIEVVQRLGNQQKAIESDFTNSPKYTVQLAYPFPDIGKILTIIFIPFAAWFYGQEIEATEYPRILGTGLFGAFAKAVVTVPLLLDVAELPADIFNLFLSVGVVASRLGDLMKASHLIAFSVITTCYLSGVCKVHLSKLINFAIGSLVLLCISVIGIRAFLTYEFQEDFSKEDLVVALDLLGEEVEDSSILGGSEPNPEAILENENRLQRIKRTKKIRVGVYTDHIPYSFMNRNGKLVGLDIDMAHELARNLEVGIRFIPIEGEVSKALASDHFDIAMSGLEGTIQRAQDLPQMEPYLILTRALVVRDYDRKRFQSITDILEDLESNSKLRVAVIKDGYGSTHKQTGPLLGRGWGAINRAGLTDKIEIVKIANHKEFFEAKESIADALITTAEAGSAYTIKYPNYTVVRPQKLEVKTPVYYYVAEDGKLKDFITSWIVLKKNNKTLQQLYNYWILGINNKREEPRWSIIRDVLDWVD
jgi:Na+/H+-dicarboxylate symporter/ABC-type amino acid transport substrate-binding protein